MLAAVPLASGATATESAHCPSDACSTYARKLRQTFPQCVLLDNVRIAGNARGKRGQGPAAPDAKPWLTTTACSPSSSTGTKVSMEQTSSSTVSVAPIKAPKLPKRRRHDEQSRSVDTADGVVASVQHSSDATLSTPTQSAGVRPARVSAKETTERNTKREAADDDARPRQKKPRTVAKKEKANRSVSVALPSVVSSQPQGAAPSGILAVVEQTTRNRPKRSRGSSVPEAVARSTGPPVGASSMASVTASAWSDDDD